MGIGDDTRLDAICHALADPTRRAILTHLATSPGATTAQLAALAPAISRFAVMKHLGVLRQAGLLRTMSEGRRRRHYRESAAMEPLQAWLVDVERAVAG
jgi:DNA-binding transcriptional ArsR family regulator